MDNQKNVFEFIASGFKLLDFIPFGKKNAIHRRDLSDLAKISDRQVRAIVKSLAKDSLILFPLLHRLLMIVFYLRSLML